MLPVEELTFVVVEQAFVVEVEVEAVVETLLVYSLAKQVLVERR